MSTLNIIVFFKAYESEEIIEIDPAVGLITILTRAISNAEDRSTSNNSVARTILNRLLAVDHLPTDKKHILSVLLNNIICLYHIVGHKQIIEVINNFNIVKKLPFFVAANEYILLLYMICLVCILQSCFNGIDN